MSRKQLHSAVGVPRLCAMGARVPEPETPRLLQLGNGTKKNYLLAHILSVLKQKTLLHLVPIDPPWEFPSWLFPLAKCKFPLVGAQGSLVRAAVNIREVGKPVVFSKQHLFSCSHQALWMFQATQEFQGGKLKSQGIDV